MMFSKSLRLLSALIRYHTVLLSSFYLGPSRVTGLTIAFLSRVKDGRWFVQFADSTTALDQLLVISGFGDQKSAMHF